MKLNKKQLNALVEKAQKNDVNAKQEIIESHANLIRLLAHKFDYTSLDFEDLYQEGVCGILKAIEKFDFSKDVKFTTLAQIYIFNFISLYVRKNGRAVRVPNYIINYYKKISDFKKSFSKKYHREPSFEIILDTINISKEMLQNILDLEKQSYSLDEPLTDGNSTFLDSLASVNTENFYFDEKESSKIDELLSCLDSTEKEIVKDWSGLYSNSRNSYKLLAEKYDESKREIKEIILNSKNKIKNNLINK